LQKEQSEGNWQQNGKEYHGANPGKLNWISVLFRDNDHTKTNSMLGETSVPGFGPSYETAVHLGVDVIKNSRPTSSIQVACAYRIYGNRFSNHVEPKLFRDRILYFFGNCGPVLSI
jgi:hypothetical protein